MDERFNCLTGLALKSLFRMQAITNILVVLAYCWHWLDLLQLLALTMVGQRPHLVERTVPPPKAVCMQIKSLYHLTYF